MADNATIGSLRVVLGADAAQLESGIDAADKKLAQFAASSAKAGAAIGAAIVAMGAAIGFGIKHAIDEADKLGKMSQKVGVPVEELSKLKLAADLSGVSMESLGSSMGKLAKNMAGIAAGKDNEVSRAFQAIGVSATDATGKLRPTVDVLGDIAQKFKGYEDGAEKTALAQQLLGRAGANLIPLLNAGRDGLKEAADEAERFGIVIDSKTAKSAEAFNDNLTRLGKIQEGIFIQIASRMLPAFENFSNAMVIAAKNSSLMDSTAKVLTVTLQTLVSAGIIVGATFTAIGDIIGSVSSAIALAAKGQFQGAWDALKAGPTDVVATVTSAAGALQTIWGTATTDMAVKSAENGPKIAAPIVKAALDSKNAVDQYLASQVKQQAATMAEITTFDLATGAKERMRVVLQTLAIAQERGITLTDEQRQKMTEVANAAEQMKLKLTGLKLEEEVRPPFQKFNDELKKNRELLDAGAISAETYGRANQMVAEKANNTWAQAGESIAGSFQKMGQAFGKENKAMATVAKAAGIVQGTISMFTGAAKALELPFPANIAAMASVLATGAGLVAQIKSTSVGGFATGGAITVPGGMGGGDRVRAMVDLEPGEQLDVWRPGEAGGDPRRGGGKGGYIEIDLKGARADDWLAMKGRDLLRIINETVGDGGRVRFA